MAEVENKSAETPQNEEKRLRGTKLPPAVLKAKLRQQGKSERQTTKAFRLR